MAKSTKVFVFFQNLREKPKIEISDIDGIAIQFFDFFTLAKEQLESSRQIIDFKQKVALQILALENFSKPIAYAELIPSPLKKWVISDYLFKYHMQAAISHEFKHVVLTQYGKVIGKLNYKYWISETDSKMLQIIKEGYQHGDSEFPYSEIQAVRLSKQLEKFLHERMQSFRMYFDQKSASVFIRKLAIRKNFSHESDFQKFILTLEDNISNYSDLALKAKDFKDDIYKMSLQANVAIGIDLDNKKDFLKQMQFEINDYLFKERVNEAKNFIYTDKFYEKIALFEKIVSDSVT